MCRKILREDFNRLDSHDKRYYELTTPNKLERSRHFKDELTDLLKKTKGKITYEEMMRQLDDIVNDDAIRKYFQSLKGFSIRKDRILPHISTTEKFRRAKWAETFWLFWKSVKAVPTTKVRIVLNHMDDKWFYVVRCRTNYIVITSIGVEPNDYYAQHKKSYQKANVYCCNCLCVE